MKRMQRFLHEHPTAASFIVLGASALAIGIIADSFFGAFNFSRIIQQITVIGILGIAPALATLTAGIDLFVAAIMVLTSVVMRRIGVVHRIPAVLISRNMPYVFNVADRIHVHRLGRRHGWVRTGDITMSEAAAIMTGAQEPAQAC